jgi:hypothetical protein
MRVLPHTPSYIRRRSDSIDLGKGTSHPEIGELARVEPPAFRKLVLATA